MWLQEREVNEGLKARNLVLENQVQDLNFQFQLLQLRLEQPIAPRPLIYYDSRAGYHWRTNEAINARSRAPPINNRNRQASASIITRPERPKESRVFQTASYSTSIWEGDPNRKIPSSEATSVINNETRSPVQSLTSVPSNPATNHQSRCEDIDMRMLAGPNTPCIIEEEKSSPSNENQKLIEPEVSSPLQDFSLEKSRLEKKEETWLELNKGRKG